MFDVEKIVSKTPFFESFCSVDKIYSLIQELEGDDRFDVGEVGRSGKNRPIYTIKYGNGSLKVLVVAGPHADEPIGSLTAFSLLMLLKSDHQELVGYDIEWNIVPCIDPDGAVLNEGWSQKSFTFENFMRFSFKQNPADQAEYSFPVSYKGHHFDSPTLEAKTFMEVLDSVNPDFCFNLHNSISSGAYFFINSDIGKDYYEQIYRLLHKYHIPIKSHVAQDSYGEGSFGYGIYKQIPSVAIYDHLVDLVDDPKKHFNWGGGACAYLKNINENAISFVPEFSYVSHPSMASKKISNYNYRQLKLKVDADNKLLFTLIMEAWEAVESDLNVDSPFYKKMAPRIAFARDALHECMPEMQWLVTKDLLFSSAYCGQASEADVFNTYMTDRYYALAYSYSFVRLLKDSKQTASIVQAIERLDSVFEEALNDIKKHIDFFYV